MQNQRVARRRRSTKPQPSGGAAPSRGPQDFQDQRVGNKGVWASAAVGAAATCAASDTGLGAVGASSIAARDE